MGFCVPPIDYYYGLKQFGSRGTYETMEHEWDIVVYEIKKALALLRQGNPNVLQMLWLPENMYTKIEPAGQLILDARDIFVGKHVYNAFVGYAVSQLRKMEGGAYRGYMGERRKQLVQKHGYDTKNAAHLIRLLYTGIEFLNDGQMTLPHPFAPKLVAIKRGEWRLEEVKAESDRLFELAAESYVRSTLPSKPDYEKVNELCVEVIRVQQAAYTQALSPA
jgi:uncharacterized protein